MTDRREEFLEALRRLAERIGRTPSMDVWNAQPDCPANAKTVAKHCGGGSWTTAVELAGLTPTAKKLPRWSVDSLLPLLQEWVERCDRPSEARWDLDHPNGPSGRTVARWFGSWTEGLRAAQVEGIERRPRRDPHDPWRPREVLAAIQRWNDQYGEPPRAMQWRRKAPPEGAWWPSYHVVTDLYGTWNTAIRAAGFVPRDSGGQVEGGKRPTYREKNRQMVTAGRHARLVTTYPAGDKEGPIR